VADTCWWFFEQAIDHAVLQFQTLVALPHQNIHVFLMGKGVSALLPRKSGDLLLQHRILDAVTEVHHAAHEEILPRRKGGEQGIEEMRAERVIGEPVQWRSVRDVEADRARLNVVFWWRRDKRG